MTTIERVNNAHQQSPGGGAEGVSPPSEIDSAAYHQLHNGIVFKIPFLDRFPGIGRHAKPEQSKHGVDRARMSELAKMVQENHQKIVSSNLILPTKSDSAAITTLAD